MFLLNIKNIQAGVRNTKIRDMNSVKSKSPGNFKFTLLHFHIIILRYCISFLEGRLHAIIDQE